jgi:two-component sensor histidine kinase
MHEGQHNTGLFADDTRQDLMSEEGQMRALADAEARQKALVDEVNHRVKNTLATVQALARYTLRGRGIDGETFRNFEGRLLALSSVHDQLARERWAGAELGLLVRDLLTLYELEDRVYLNGAAVWLAPKQAIALVMALQELLSNAARHGSLSTPAGHVRLDWQRDDLSKDAQLKLDWREDGGPAIVHSSGRGLGHQLIEHAVREELGGSVRLDFVPDGLRCRVSIPLPGKKR